MDLWQNKWLFSSTHFRIWFNLFHHDKNLVYRSWETNAMLSLFSLLKYIRCGNQITWVTTRFFRFCGCPQWKFVIQITRNKFLKPAYVLKMIPACNHCWCWNLAAGTHNDTKTYIYIYIYIYLPTPPLRQDMTQGQFLSGV